MNDLAPVADPAPEPVASNALHARLFDRLDSSIADLWGRAKEGAFFRHVLSEGCSPELYRVTMLQMFHYTRHNSIHQAVAVLGTEPAQHALLRYAYTHAREELGHELLIVHDLRSIGLREPEVVEPPLPATDALINYLYGVALRAGLIPRLGYSYWAESAYEHIGPLLLSVQKSLDLSDRNMTFFAAHSTIDEKHVKQVRKAIREGVSTQAQADDVHRVAVTTLWLTIQILEETFEASKSSRREP